MDSPNLNPALLRRYLLGQMAEEEKSALESAYLGKADLLDALDVAEMDLIHDYIGGSLSSADASSFENHFLQSNAARRKVNEARFVQAYLSRRARRTRWTTALLVAAASLAVVAAAVYWPRGLPSPAPVSRLPQTVAPPPSIAFSTLTAGRLRNAEGTPQNVISVKPETILLHIALQGSKRCAPGACDVELRDPDRILLASFRYAPRTDPPAVEIPASVLPSSGDYVLEIVDRTGSIASYQFRIIR